MRQLIATVALVALSIGCSHGGSHHGGGTMPTVGSMHSIEKFTCTDYLGVRKSIEVCVPGKTSGCCPSRFCEVCGACLYDCPPGTGSPVCE